MISLITTLAAQLIPVQARIAKVRAKCFAALFMRKTTDWGLRIIRGPAWNGNEGSDLAAAQKTRICHHSVIPSGLGIVNELIPGISWGCSGGISPPHFV